MGDKALKHELFLREERRAERETMRDRIATLTRERDGLLAHVETRDTLLRGIVQQIDDMDGVDSIRADIVDALAASPAQSLAEHDKAVEARVAERFLKWAEFGAWAFEAFWQDGEPGDLEGGDLQERAVALGLLGRTAEHDAGATHAEGCEWQPGMPVEDCDCYAPLAAPFDAAAIRREFGVTR